MIHWLMQVHSDFQWFAPKSSHCLGWWLYNDPCDHEIWLNEWLFCFAQSVTDFQIVLNYLGCWKVIIQFTIKRTKDHGTRLGPLMSLIFPKGPKKSEKVENMKPFFWERLGSCSKQLQNINVYQSVSSLNHNSSKLLGESYWTTNTISPLNLILISRNRITLPYPYTLSFLILY